MEHATDGPQIETAETLCPCGCGCLVSMGAKESEAPSQEFCDCGCGCHGGLLATAKTHCD